MRRNYRVVGLLLLPEALGARSLLELTRMKESVVGGKQAWLMVKVGVLALE